MLKAHFPSHPTHPKHTKSLSKAIVLYERYGITLYLYRSIAAEHDFKKISTISYSAKNLLT